MIIFHGCREDGIRGSRRPPVSCELMTDVWWPRHAWCSEAPKCRRPQTEWTDECFVVYEQHVAELWPACGPILVKDNMTTSGVTQSLLAFSSPEKRRALTTSDSQQRVAFNDRSNLFKLTRWVVERWTAPSHFLIMCVCVCVHVLAAFSFYDMGYG